jgi:hypothetical protein
LYVIFGLTVEKLWNFEDFSPSSCMLSTIVNAAKFAQNYPKLPKFAKIYPKTISLRSFEMPPKLEILVFFKNKNFYV